MKKLLVTALIASMSFSVIGCGSSDSESTTAADTAVETDATEEAVVSAPEWDVFDNLIQEIKAATDLEAREALMHDAEDMLMDTGAILPLYYYNDVFMARDTVTGIYTNNYGDKYFDKATAPDGVLKANLASEPDKLDPTLNSSLDGSILAKMNFAGLYAYDENGELAPQLATGYEMSEDGLTYVFTMKEDLVWSDGTPLDASDFEYTWKRAVAPETAADYAYMLDVMAYDEDGELAVVASEDGSTLTVTLAAPCAYFLDLVAFTTLLPVPQHAVEEAATELDPGAWAQEAGFVGNGPFVLESWTHDESMVYVKNENYHDADSVQIERIELMLSSDDTAIYAAYQAGSLDFIDSIPTDEIASLLDNDEFYIVDMLGTYFASFNVNSPLFEGKTVEEAAAMRKAISLLIDREYIAENIGQAGQQVATSFIPIGMLDGNGGEFKSNDDAYEFPYAEDLGYIPTSYDLALLDEARELLEFAGYEFDADGTLSAATPIALEYLTNEGTGHVAVAEAMQQDFAALGIDMTISSVEWNVFLDERKLGNFDFCRDGWIADFNDPINMLEMWTTESGNNNCQFGR